MNLWLSIALVAYLVGGLVEGVTAARQLTHSAPELAQQAQDLSTDSTEPVAGWRLMTAIAAVSICGAFSWPCRLIHRSIKGEPERQGNE